MSLVKQPVSIAEAEMIKTDSVQSENIEFTDISKKQKIQLFCYGHHPGSVGVSAQANGQLCDRAGALQFLESLPEEPTTAGPEARKGYSHPSFTLIGAHGNGTLKPLSLDRDLFHLIMTRFRLPPRVRTLIRSIHGVFVKFVEDEEEDGVKSLLIILSTPKSPVREVFLAMRVRVVHGQCSVTCLLFDCEPADLRRIKNLMLDSVAEMDCRNPLAFLTLLIQDIGRTSEERRGKLDLKILDAELKTHSTSWGNKSNLIVRWPDDSYQTMSALHICHNNLVFVVRAVDVEVDAWRELQDMAKDGALKPFLRAKTSKRMDTALLNTIEFELAYTESRRAQIRGLKERVEVQINLIHNMMAHQEASQTNLIAIVALIFAPASLTAGIFSAGIFQTDGRSWIAYLASTLPVTFLTVTVGLVFLEQHRVKRGWQVMSDLLRSTGKRGKPLEQSV